MVDNVLHPPGLASVHSGLGEQTLCLGAVLLEEAVLLEPLGYPGSPSLLRLHGRHNATTLA